ncbi:MAG: 16S rRNA (cytidine(1402)-2'-O)-methyltransferase [Pseudomonadota bacterium]
MSRGTLFVVATPIGNLDDLSTRAQRTLRDVDVIAAEDTRHTGRLLSHFAIKTPQIALHEHNEQQVVPALAGRLLSGESVALVSDAGTPLISDPGFRLIDAAHAGHVQVSPIPGPSAVTAALSAAGIGTDRFCFEGFLPAKTEARRARLEQLTHEPRSLVFFVSVHKVDAVLADLAEAFGSDRPACVARELSKLHEQCVRASLGDLLEWRASGEIPAKGEFVVVVAGAPGAGDTSETDVVRRWLAELAAVLPGRQAVDIVSRVSGARRNDVYRLLLEMKRESDPS